MKKIALLFSFCFCSSAFALTCEELDGAYLYSQEKSPVYLGFFGDSSIYDSINNLEGDYGYEPDGNSFTNSVRNPKSRYGSPEPNDLFSAVNASTNTPPVIYMLGKAIGFLTANRLLAGGIPLPTLDHECPTFSSTAPKTGTDTEFHTITNCLTGLWYIPEESGWGVSLEQQSDIVFVTIFTYDSNGFPLWYVVSDCGVEDDSCSGKLYEVVGGSPLTDPWDGANKIVTDVGKLTFEVTDEDNATMSFVINGLAATKMVTRQIFN